MTITLTIERDGVELDAEVQFRYSPGYPGRRDRYGAPEEPDEYPAMEYDGATVDGVPVELTDTEIDRAEAKAWELKR